VLNKSNIGTRSSFVHNTENMPAAFRAASWPPLRNALLSLLRQHRPHTFWGFGEVDVTDALAAIRRHERTLRVAVSFHAFVMHCLARAAADHSNLLTYRHGRSLVTFADADVGTVIDRRLTNGVRLPVGYIVRAAQNKSPAAINWELRRAIRVEQLDSDALRLRRNVARMPDWVRRMVSWRIMRNPFMLRRFHGTIGLTNLHNPALRTSFHALPPNIYTYTLAIGSMFERVTLDDQGRPEKRKILCLSAGADHAVVDGMALTAFAGRLAHLLEAGAGLGDDFVEQTRQLMIEQPA
jgi:pyruvate/2-oxoglutarate dehydrogenase complex dihydrolipoamide acyltransferase (E2) component